MPIKIQLDGEQVTLRSSDREATFVAARPIGGVEVDRNFYVETAKIE